MGYPIVKMTKTSKSFGDDIIIGLTAFALYLEKRQAYVTPGYIGQLCAKLRLISF